MRVRLSRAEQQRQTRERVLEAAEQLFVEKGFHGTSVDGVAAEAGYTRGAVYSNFESKEDLFFAVYERRAERAIAEWERAIGGERGPVPGLDAVVVALTRRRGHDDGWLATFFEFWAYAVRRPALRARFAAIHVRAQEPLVQVLEADAREHGYELPDDARKLTVALYAMQLGLQLEHLTLPELADSQLGLRMNHLFFDDLRRGPLAHQGAGDEPDLPAQAAR